MAQRSPHLCPIIIGREPELAVAAEALTAAAGGRGQALLIVGEAGIGKSRLAATVAASAAAAGFGTLAGVCYEQDRDLPFAPFIDLLRQQVHDSVPDRLAPLLGADLTAFARLVPELLPPGEAHPLPALPPEHEKRRLFEAVADLVASHCRAGPLLLVLEDLHWADETSLELLQRLPRRLAGAPLLLLMTARTDEAGGVDRWRAALERGRLLTCLELRPLGEAAVAAMVAATLGQSAPGAVVSAVHARAEGNPFLVEEFLRELVDEAGERALSTLDRAAVERLQIPLSVDGSIGRRLDGLAEPARRVAEAAAVAGRRCAFDLLGALTGLDEPSLIVAVRALIAQQLIVEEVVDGEPTLAFRHALTRDAIYRRLLIAERRRLHRLVARASAEAGRPIEAGELGYHYHAAGEWALALDLAGRAGDEARAVWSNMAALAHYRRALDAARHLPAVANEVLLELHHARGMVLAVLGDFPAAQADLAEALRRADGEGDAGRAGRVHQALAGLWASRSYDLALGHAKQAVELARHGGQARDEAVALNRLGNIMVNQARFDEGRAEHAAALATFARLGDRWGVADSLDLTAMACYLAGDVPEARALFQRARGLFEALGDRERVASCLTTRSLYLAVLDGPCAFDGDPDTCLAEASQAAERCRELDWRAGEAYALTAIACAHLARGDYGAGLATAAASERLARQIGHPQWAIIAGLTRAIGLADLGDPAGAAAVLGPLREEAVVLGFGQWAWRLQAWLAACTLHQGDPIAAEAALGPLLPAGQPRSIGERRALFTLAELALERGQPQVALELAARLAPSPAEGTPAPPLPALLLLWAHALAAGGDLASARERLLEAHAAATTHGPRGLRWRISADLAALARRTGRPERALLERARAELAEVLHGIDEAELRAALLRTRQGQYLSDAPPGDPADDGLTRREREVATLVATGKTNRQIAETLFIAEKTVEMHVSNCLGKLGFRARAQLAAWAVGRSLAAAPSAVTTET